MISVIICTYNRDKYLYDALQHVSANDFPTDAYEIVLINNNSTDNTEMECERFKTDFPSVRFRYFVETKQGLSHARNRGIRESNGDVLVFLDDDSFVKPDYLKNLQRQLEKHPEASAFGGKITPIFESGKTPKWLCRWNYSWVSAIDKGDVVVPFEGSSYPIGANMGFRKSCLDQVGDFNTELGRSKKNLIGGEEKDIFNRAKSTNLTILYFPDIQVEHVIPPQRTTKEYIAKMGQGIGMSERIRCLNIGNRALWKRFFFEAIKWGAPLLLWVRSAISFRPIVGNMLLLFRWNVTKGLVHRQQSY
jgi:glycosyltransferase involved in cell wall biosynthesis